MTSLVQSSRFNGPDVISPEEPTIKWLALSWYDTLADRLKIWNGSGWVSEDDMMFGSIQNPDLVDTTTENKDIRTLLGFYQEGIPPHWAPIGIFWIKPSDKRIFIKRNSGLFVELTRTIAAVCGGNTTGDRRSGTYTNDIEFFVFDFVGVAYSFSNLSTTDDILRCGLASASNGPGGRLVLAGGLNNLAAVIANITFLQWVSGSMSNNFGDLTVAATELMGVSNNINGRALFAGGYRDTVGGLQAMSYVGIATSSSATAFGDLSEGKVGGCAASNGIGDKAIFIGGNILSSDIYEVWDFSNTIDTCLISTPANATSFGVMAQSRAWAAAVSNLGSNKGVIAGGVANDNSPDASALSLIQAFSITLPDTAPSGSFGNLTAARNSLCGSSNGVNGKAILSGGWSGGHLMVADTVMITTPANATGFANLNVGRSLATSSSNA